MAVVLAAENRGTDRVVDHREFVLVADPFNHRVVRWREAAREGEVVAGGNGAGNRLDQLQKPGDVAVERDGAMLVVDTFNHRVVRWRAASREGEVSHGVVGGLVSFSPLERANFTGLVLGFVEAKFCK